MPFLLCTYLVQCTFLLCGVPSPRECSSHALTHHTCVPAFLYSRSSLSTPGSSVGLHPHAWQSLPQSRRAYIGCSISPFSVHSDSLPVCRGLHRRMMGGSALINLVMMTVHVAGCRDSCVGCIRGSQLPTPLLLPHFCHISPPASLGGSDGARIKAHTAFGLQGQTPAAAPAAVLSTRP